MPGFETTVQRCEQWLGESLSETGQYATERSFLRSFHDELEPDDEVWVVGARDGLYGAVAAAVVGADGVAVFEDDAERRERVRETLSGAGIGGVHVGSLGEMDVRRQRPTGDPGVAEATAGASAEEGAADGGAAPDSGAPDLPRAPTVLVLDEPAAGEDLLDRLSVGHLLGVRYLLVKSDTRAAADRLRATGYETSRLRRFDPLRTPWMQVVEARRDPGLPVKPVASSVVGGTASSDGRERAVGERLLGTLGVDPSERPRLARLVAGTVRLGVVLGGFLLVSALVAGLLGAGVSAAGYDLGMVPVVAVVGVVLFLVLSDAGTPEEER